MKKWSLLWILLVLVNVVWAQVIKVEITKTSTGNYQLLRGGKPFYVKGAGGDVFMDKTVAAGGNSIRLWGAENAQAVLDYEGYVKTVTAKGETELAKAAVRENLFETYSFIGANYATTDKVKAIENFKKAAEINPNDVFVKESLQALNK
jgi:hypothetical protein